MDRALKERVVGASVLVVVAVLVVPVFLDGPPDEIGTVRESVTLPGQGEQGSRRQTIVLERDRDQPVPAGTSERSEREPRPAPDERPAAAPETRQPPPQPEPQARPQPQPVTAQSSKPAPAAGGEAAAGNAPQPAAAKKADSATGMWAVQLGSFSDQANADKLAADLRKAGYAAFLSRVQSRSAVLHRVRVGPQQDRKSAEQVAAQLSGDGHKGQVVPHP